MQNTSWEKSSKWYNKIVGDEGHYFHQAVIFPNLKKIINFNEYKSNRAGLSNVGNNLTAKTGFVFFLVFQIS
jgi:hypothetical protein